MNALQFIYLSTADGYGVVSLGAMLNNAHVIISLHDSWCIYVRASLFGKDKGGMARL